MVKKLLLSGWLMLIALPLSFAVEIAVADVYLIPMKKDASKTEKVFSTLPFNEEEEAYSRKLMEMLIKEDSLHMLDFIPVYNEIRSAAEALQWINNHETPYLLYGTYQKESEQRAILNVYLYDKATKTQRELFTIVEDPKYIPMMYKHMAEKIIFYLYGELKVEVFEQVRLPDGFALSLLAGYSQYIPSHQYFVGTGVAAMELRYRIHSEQEQFPIMFPYMIGHVGYSLAINQPEYQPLVFHQVRIGIGAGVGFEWNHRHLLLLDARYTSEIGIVNIQKLNTNNKKELWHTAGMMVNLGYEHWINKHVGFGIHNHFYLLFDKNQPLHLNYNILLSVSIAFPPRKKQQSRSLSHINL